MLWISQNLIFFLFSSAMEFVTANDQCRNDVYKEWLSGDRSSEGGQWRLFTSAMSNVDKRSHAEAITIIENTKYVN